MNRRLFSTSRRRSSGGPAGRHGPWGSDGASNDEPGPPGNGGSRGRGTTTVTAAFCLSGPPTRRPLTSEVREHDMTTIDHPRRRRPGPRRRRRRRAARRRRPRRSAGRPAGATIRRPSPAPTLVVEASRGDAVLDRTSRAALDAGVRRFVIATTGWDGRPRRASRRSSAITAPPPSPRRTSASASRCSAGSSTRRSRCSAASTAFDPYLVEWHRRAKRDRPSGTARDLAGRIVDGHPRPERAGRPRGRLDPGRRRRPGMHLVGFDAPGETVELRLTARDRSAYAAGILAAADWLDPGAAPARPPPLRPHRRRAAALATAVAA